MTGKMISHGTHDVVKLVDELLARGLAARATDLHFEPVDDGMLVRLRVDGQLIDFESIPPNFAENVISRLKVLASLLTYRVDIPQEGGLRWTGDSREGGDRAVDLRVATFPTIRGERAVIRVFGIASEPAGGGKLEALGLAAEQVDQLRRAVSQPAGLIVVTGPAGSGKTTTLYAMISHLRDNHRERSVITLEDPVEQRIDRVTQIQINPHGELSYERCMRSLLRQDPQVMLLGEVRDGRTAAVAIEAALTGHLILTTVHSGDPAEAVVRFLEMGVAPYQLVSALTVVCSQRLLRKTCRACGAERESAAAKSGSLDGKSARAQARGSRCAACLGTGYHGRTAIAQTVEVDEPARQLILQHPTASQLREMFKRQGLDLIDRAQAMVSRGDTDETEVARVLGTR